MKLTWDYMQKFYFICVQTKYMEKSVFKEILPPNFFSTKYTKNIIKNEITSICLKN